MVSSELLILLGKNPEPLVRRSVFVSGGDVRFSVAAVGHTFSQSESGSEFDALNAESIAIDIQFSHDCYLFILKLCGAVLVVELVSLCCRQP